jgi:hypothetical protein
MAMSVEYKGNKVNAFWVKTKGSESKEILISADIDLTFNNAMNYYHLRWNIEVLFKGCKLNLNINNCQSTDFDAHIASITISFIIYILHSFR